MSGIPSAPFSVIKYQDRNYDQLERQLINADLQLAPFTPCRTEQLMPWLRFTTGSIATTNSIDCCERVNTGPIIIVWREPEPAFHRLQGITPDRTGIVARLATYDKLEFAIPAYQSITGVAVIRVDPRFARAAVGDSVDLEVTLMDTRKSDEESAETIPESDLKGGVGASAGNKPCGAAQDAIQPLPK